MIGLFGLRGIRRSLKDIIYYISGYVAKSFIQIGSLKCASCIEVFHANEPTILNLISFKNRGFLVHLSVDVFTVCIMCAIAFRKRININGDVQAKGW